MKRFNPFAAIAVVIAFSLTAYGQEPKICLTEVMFQERAKADPSLLLKRAAMEQETAAFVSMNQGMKKSGVAKVIPVVFHVIHEADGSNISKAQIENALVLLNQDFSRTNPDASQTPSVFQPLGADTEIEFRLAQKDPNGNCTDGITRTYSHLANNARNNVKGLIYWPSNMYLNVWTVKSIENVNGTPGQVIGFSQFPGTGPATTDGVVLVHNYVGDIGTAASSNYKGRTFTHEVGHWFNLRHIWGDATCGNDMVSDTPVQNVNNSTCPSFPKIDVQCNNGPSGAMFSNYMDYTRGNCQNIFTWGQNARMQAALNSSTSGRNNLWSQSNLVATGTDGSPPQLCAPVAAFNSNAQFICEGASITWQDFSYNGTVANWDWQFGGGTPSSSTQQNPTITYNTPGTYGVTLTVSNASGNDSKSVNGVVIVSPASASVINYPWSEGFESGGFPKADWFLTNESPFTNTWELTSLAAHSGANSVYINNYIGNGNGVDEFITNSFNLSFMTGTTLSYWRAFAHRAQTPNDILRVYASSNCGQLWTLRLTRSGLSLSTAGLISSPFYPNASQWTQDNVSLAASLFSGKPNVRIKFQYTQDTGNNIYIDDINLNGTVSVNEIDKVEVPLEVYPNPTPSKASIEFQLDREAAVTLQIVDMTGRQVRILAQQRLPAGEYLYDVDAGLAAGSYFVHLRIGNQLAVRKLIIE